MNVLGIIPARYGSTRFPGKPLVMIDRKSMIQRVYEQALKAELLDKVVVATDDNRIFEHVKAFGGDVIMTSVDHQNGTSRCNEVLNVLDAADSGKYQVVINIQGDEPYIEPSQIDSIAALFSNPECEIGTLVKQIKASEELFNPNVVKVVCDVKKRALYFSRQTIPMLRDTENELWFKTYNFFKHIGIYGYRSDILKKIVMLKPGKLEEAEKLEQLRWLENGFRIQLEETYFEGIAIDTPDDLLKLSNIN